MIFIRLYPFILCQKAATSNLSALINCESQMRAETHQPVNTGCQLISMAADNFLPSWINTQDRGSLELNAYDLTIIFPYNIRSPSRQWLPNSLLANKMDALTTKNIPERFNIPWPKEPKEILTASIGWRKLKLATTTKINLVGMRESERDRQTDWVGDSDRERREWGDGEVERDGYREGAMAGGGGMGIYNGQQRLMFITAFQPLHIQTEECGDGLINDLHIYRMAWLAFF